MTRLHIAAADRAAAIDEIVTFIEAQCREADNLKVENRHDFAALYFDAAVEHIERIMRIIAHYRTDGLAYPHHLLIENKTTMHGLLTDYGVSEDRAERIMVALNTS
jgi:hypothetical protein